MRKYNGKYPYRIRTVWTDDTHQVHVRTNNGEHYLVSPGVSRTMPRPGDEVYEGSWSAILINEE